jgi:hypothetical protein
MTYKERSIVMQSVYSHISREMGRGGPFKQVALCSDYIILNGHIIHFGEILRFYERLQSISCA